MSECNMNDGHRAVFWMSKRVRVHAKSDAFKEGQELACKVISCKGGE